VHQPGDPDEGQRRRIHRRIASPAGRSTGNDLYQGRPEAHMTSLNSRNGVSREGIAVPGEVRRWRTFALLAVAASRKPDPR
jgi:hypothetical protein